MRSLGILALVLALVTGAAWLLGSGRDGALRQSRQEERAASGSSAPAVSLRDPGVALPPSEDPGLQREEVEPAPASQPEGTKGRAWLVVRVLARESEQPLAGVHTRLTSAHEAAAWHRQSSRRAFESTVERTKCPCPVTDAEGRVELEAHVGWESMLLVNVLETIHAPQEMLDVTPLAEGERREVEVRLRTHDDLRWFGRVLDDATGAPLSGASAVRSAGARFGSVVGAADGILVVEFATWQTTRLEVEVPGYLRRTVVLERGYDGPERAYPVRMVRPAALDVRVRDGVGAPRAGLRVEVESLEPQDSEVERPAFSARKSTDGDGACSFEDLPPRENLSVAVRAGIGQTQRRNVVLSPGERRALEFELGTGCRLQGVAVDEQGEPVAELDLWRVADAGFPGAFEPEHERLVVDKARTDGRGRFTFEGVPAGDWWIGPAPYHRAWGLLTQATRVTIPVDQSVHTLRVVCRSARSALYIRGQVLTEEGSPARASVTASRNGERVSADSWLNGRYVVGPLAGGEWLVQARNLDDSHAPSEAVRVEAGRSDVRLILKSGVGLSGVVLDEDGTRVAGAEVILSPDEHGFSASAVSDEYGFFDLGGQAPGIYTVCAKSGARAGVLGPFALEPGSAKPRLEPRLALGAELRVRLVGGAKDGVFVRVSWNDALVVVDGLSPGGELRETLPPGTVVVQLLHRSADEGSVVLEQQRVELRAGETSLVELMGGSDPSAAR